MNSTVNANSSPQPVRILIVGTGGMAHQHVWAYQKIPAVKLVGAVDVNPERLQAFAQKYEIPETFGSVEKAVAWGDFDAASVVTPDGLHYAATMPLLAAGKHVLCEKPLASNASDAEEMAAVAARAGVINMMNLTYRNESTMQKAAQLVRDGAIGEVRFFEASFLQSWLHQPAWGDWKTDSAWTWKLSTAHGSRGALGDAGVHILDYATFIIGQDVVEVSGRLTTYNKALGGRVGKFTLDANDSAIMSVACTGGSIGTIIATRAATGHLNDMVIKVYGETGALDLRYRLGESELHACLGVDNVLHGKWEPVDCPPVRYPSNYERFVAAIRDETTPDPDFARGAALQKILDLAEGRVAPDIYARAT